MAIHPPILPSNDVSIDAAQKRARRFFVFVFNLAYAPSKTDDSRRPMFSRYNLIVRSFPWKRDDRALPARREESATIGWNSSEHAGQRANPSRRLSERRLVPTICFISRFLSLITRTVDLSADRPVLSFRTNRSGFRISPGWLIKALQSLLRYRSRGTLCK